MVVINPEINQKLSHFSKRESDMAKLILFSVDNGLRLRGFLTYPLEADSMVKKLELLGLLKLDYIGGNEGKPTYVVGVPMYIKTDKPIEVSNLNTQNLKRFLESHIDEYRAVFSVDGKGKKGLKSGTMGDKWDCIKKLEKWFKRTKFSYTWEEVINTARVYVSKEKDNGYKYLQAADYFILKDNRSRLGSLIEDYKVAKPVRSDDFVFKQMV